MADKLKGILIATAAIAVLAMGGVAIATATNGNEPSQPTSVATQATENETAENEANENETNENETNENEAAEQATGPRADDAARAALQAVGGGKVLEVETADDGMSGFEVEIEKPDGSYVEVNLDENLRVVGTGSDD